MTALNRSAAIKALVIHMFQTHWLLVGLRILQVPEQIHNEWRQGGASRARLQELFANCNFVKAYQLYSHAHAHIPHKYINAEKSYKRGYHHVRGGVSNTALEAAFIRHVTLEIERRRSVKVKVKAGWATEEKMRDVLNLTPFLAQNIL